MHYHFSKHTIRKLKQYQTTAVISRCFFLFIFCADLNEIRIQMSKYLQCSSVELIENLLRRAHDANNIGSLNHTYTLLLSINKQMTKKNLYISCARVFILCVDSACVCIDVDCISIVAFVLSLSFPFKSRFFFFFFISENTKQTVFVLEYGCLWSKPKIGWVFFLVGLSGN